MQRFRNFFCGWTFQVARINVCLGFYFEDLNCGLLVNREIGSIVTFRLYGIIMMDDCVSIINVFMCSACVWSMHERWCTCEIRVKYVHEYLYNYSIIIRKRLKYKISGQIPRRTSNFTSFYCSFLQHKYRGDI